MTAPRMRASHVDRQAAVDGLTRHFTEGRLDAGEFDDRVGKAYAATYLDELPALFVDLPPDQPGRAHGSGPHWQDRGSDPFAPAGRPGPWSGSGRREFHGPPRFLIVLVMLAVVMSISAVAHGVFPFPLIWIALVLLLMARRRRRHYWAGSAPSNRWR